MGHHLSRRANASFPLPLSDPSSEQAFPPSDLIYMTPDGDSVLESIDPTKVYVIGGIVDRTISKVFFSLFFSSNLIES